MGVIKAVLQEELENARRMIQNFRHEMEKFPGGSFVCKKIKGHQYYYLAVRKGAKVHFVYKGKEVSKEDKAALKNNREKRQVLKQHIQKLNKRVKYLEKVLKGNEDV